MSDLLTWKLAPPAPKTGTTMAALFTDLNVLFTSMASDAEFLWEVASYNDSATPYHLVLKRKSGVAGRILIVAWTTAPAFNHATLCVSGAPSTTSVYITFFPAGNTDTPLNLAAASGPILGDDTDALLLSHTTNVGSVYTTGHYVYAYAHKDGVLIFFDRIDYSSPQIMGAGYLVVDYSDVAYACTFATSATCYSFISAFNWDVRTEVTSTSWAMVRINYGGNNRMFFHPWVPAGSWVTETTISDTSTPMYNFQENKMYYFSLQLISATPGEVWALRWRQMAFSPAAVPGGANREIYDSSGTVPDAHQPTLFEGSAYAHLFLTNFKVPAS